MATPSLRRAVQHICRNLTPRPDSELLTAFVESGDDDAFAELVARHGPTVLGVCRRVLGNSADAEDAFQAVFLVLARRAAAVHPPELVGSWLYGVALRTARKMRSLERRRRVRELAMPIRESADQPNHDPELAELLDRELARLPDHYRSPILLCDVEGLSRREAAARLGCPEGTVAGHLARGRAMLARRLLRRGIAPSVAAAALGAREASAVPPALAASAARAGAAVRAGIELAGVVSLRAAELAQAVGAAGLGRWKMAIATVALIATVGLGGGGGTQRGPSAQYVKPPSVAEASPAATEPDSPADVKPPVDADDASAAKPNPETEAVRRYERAHVLFEEAQARGVTKEVKNAKLHEAKEILVENLAPALRDTEPRVHELSMYLNGHVLFTANDFVTAEAALGAALKLYPQSREAPQAKYLLCRALYFQAGLESRMARDEKVSESDRQVATTRMKELLARARDIAVPLEIALALADEPLTADDEALSRQVSFLVAECYFFAEKFDWAVSCYKRIRERYAGRIEELIALSQLWQCYAVYLDRPEEAKSMLAGMRDVLKKLPGDVFDGSIELRTRKHWEDWIKKASGNTP